MDMWMDTKDMSNGQNRRPLCPFTIFGFCRLCPFWEMDTMDTMDKMDTMDTMDEMDTMDIVSNGRFHENGHIPQLDVL